MTPILISTAKTEPANTVRVTWTASSTTELVSSNPGVDLDNLDKAGAFKYGVSKAGNHLHAVEFARWYRYAGIVSVALNPGILKSELNRNSGAVVKTLAFSLNYLALCSSYMQLFVRLPLDVTLERSE